MKLDTEFIKLPLLFDVERLKHEVAAISESDWQPHATGYAGNFSVPLISLNGELNDAMHGPMQETEILGNCEYIRQVMARFDEVFGRSRLMRLGPGHEVPPHVDINYHWLNRVRIHVPISTTPEVRFLCGEHEVHMAAGEAWIFNSWTEHAVINGSDKIRDHLVLDTTGSTRFWDMVEKSERPFVADSQASTSPEFVAYEPGKPVSIRTETYNTPLVQSPGELDLLIRILVDDVVCRNDAEAARCLSFQRMAAKFVGAWREVWAQHAMKPSGWPIYHELVRKADAGAHAIAGDLALVSGIDLAPAFRSLVLSSAVNEEFAPQYLDKDEVPSHLRKVARSYRMSTQDRN